MTELEALKHIEAELKGLMELLAIRTSCNMDLYQTLESAVKQAAEIAAEVEAED